MKKSVWTMPLREHTKADRYFSIGMCLIVFLGSFLTGSLVKASINRYSFTPYEYHKLMQNTCLMGEKVADSEGNLFRVIAMRGPRITSKEGKVIGETTAFFGVNQEGDKAVLNIYTEIFGKDKVTRTIVVLSDINIDGKPDLEGDGNSELHEVSEDGKTHWNVWIVRFIEEVTK